MIPIVIDSKKIQRLKTYAEEHRLDAAEVDKIMAGDAPVPGERPEYVCYLDPGWKLVYSIGEYLAVNKHTQETARFWVQHMSMSVNVEGRAPNMTTLSLVAKELGFPPLEQCRFSVDQENGIVEIMNGLKD